MADNKNKPACIGIEREANVLKYTAQMNGEPPRQITKAQYNHIVKLLKAQDWANNPENEEIVISRIISEVLQTTESS